MTRDLATEIERLAAEAQVEREHSEGEAKAYHGGRAAAYDDVLAALDDAEAPVRADGGTDPTEQAAEALEQLAADLRGGRA
jgi:hypothetical protein